MKLTNSQRWKLIRDFVIGWTFAFVLLSIVRGVGTRELGSMKFSFGYSILISFTVGPFIGVISGMMQILLEDYLLNKLSIYRFLIYRLLYSIVFLFILLIGSFLTIKLYLDIPIYFKSFAIEQGSLAIYIYLLVTDFFVSILRQINLMIGSDNLAKILRGRFYSPREEDRIFMFLDLQGSTQLAEKLGHIKYSNLIQDCFYDLSVVSEQKTEIYQYVGDEAILTWTYQKGIENANCLFAYYNFKQELARKKDYYLKQYLCVPFFKAGVHGGKVTTTQVGKNKKEIAYHGDTVNSTSRIQGKCNEFQQEFLASEQIKKELESFNVFDFKAIGSIPLKGKTNSINVYGIKEKN